MTVAEQVLLLRIADGLRVALLRSGDWPACQAAAERLGKAVDMAIAAWDAAESELHRPAAAVTDAWERMAALTTTEAHSGPIRYYVATSTTRPVAEARPDHHLRDGGER